MFIYVLFDPRDSEDIRYVGATQNPKKRLSVHLSDKKTFNHRANWIRSVLSDGVKPKMKVIEDAPDDDWQSREKYWIKYYRNAGFNLTNQTDGGDGTLNPSEETRAKISAATSGEMNPRFGVRGENHPWFGKHHTAETKAKISATNRGLTRSPEVRQRISNSLSGKNSPLFGVKGKDHPLFGKKASEETKTLLSIQKTGEKNPMFGKKRSPETCAKISVARIGRKESPETCAKKGEASRLAWQRRKQASQGAVNEI